MSPGLGEIGIKVRLKSGSLKSFVGSEDFTGCGSCGGFIHPESTIWRIIFVLSFKSIFGDHGSHENIIWVSGESGWNNSLILSIEHAVFVCSNEISLDCRVIRFWEFFTFIDNGRLVWWSTIGLFDGMVTVGFLDLRIGSVVLDRSEAPDWFSKILDSLSWAKE